MQLSEITKEWLYEEYVVKNRRCEDIATELGCGKANVSYLANTKFKFHKRRRVVVGSDFGKLTVIDPYCGNDQFGHPICLCKCSCGTQDFKVVRGSLLSGFTKSCGCLRPNQSPEHEFISKRVWKNLRRGAEVRKIKFEITIDYIWQLFEEQQRQCALSGLPITMNVDASLDRIDSTHGYAIGNVQWLHQDVNTMKWDFTQDRLIELCRLIIERNK